MAPGWQFLKENIVALLWMLALVLGPIGSLCVALLLGFYLRPSTAWYLATAVFGIILVVGGAGWFVREQLGHADSRREQLLAALSRREADKLRYVAKQFHSMGNRRELDASFWSALQTIADILGGLAEDREATVTWWEQSGLQAAHRFKLSILLGLLLAWIGTLAQGLALWWGVAV